MTSILLILRNGFASLTVLLFTYIVLHSENVSALQPVDPFIVVAPYHKGAYLAIDNKRLRISFSTDYSDPSSCSSTDWESCYTWGFDGPLLTVTKIESNRWRVQLKNLGHGPTNITMSLEGKHLFGGPVNNYWPAETAPAIFMVPYVTGGVAAVTERMWFTSAGEAIKISDESHLFLSQTSDKMILTFMDKPPYTSDNATVDFDWCVGKNARDAYACFPQRGRLVESKMIESPIWSTWVRYKASISQDIILSFANEILTRNFSISVMEIDDKWETCYGNHEWDMIKFPNPRAMIEKLKSQGLLVTLWVHPFINIDCSFFNESTQYLFQDKTTGLTGVTSWWNGLGGLIDFNNIKAANWFTARLNAIKSSVNVTGFKFDAGEAKYIPGLFQGFDSIQIPNSYTYNYVNMAAKFGTMGEVRVGSGNAMSRIFQRLQDTDSHWEASKSGLRSVIPNVLTLMALGYPAVIPDMVGGNLYTAQTDKELFIRWLQVNTFLPVIQFSIPPWQYDQETVELAAQLCDLHTKYADKIIKEIGSSNQSGKRAINPVWWLAPDDEMALTIDSEFLLGEDLLAAPVVEKGAFSRDIYLPNGTWIDVNHKAFVGPTLIKDYPAPLNVLPYFIKISTELVEITRI